MTKKKSCRVDFFFLLNGGLLSSNVHSEFQHLYRSFILDAISSAKNFRSNTPVPLSGVIPKAGTASIFHLMADISPNLQNKQALSVF